jgi:hydrogenase maturation protein HypF
MAAFTMCEQCQSEYEDPGNRRFHAQPNACAVCGPAARLLGKDAKPVENGGDFVKAAASALEAGCILAIKGLGGYHLACMANNDEAVSRLRALKHREEKPFALMARDLAGALRVVELDRSERDLMESRARPIVLARRRGSADVARGVAPHYHELGVMLPYTPLHHLLLGDLDGTLVMTSGNRSDEPIAFRDDDAIARLSCIADMFLTHDRPIETRVDDSIARVVTVGGERVTQMLRRSRGYVPAPITLPLSASEPVLACGGHLKNTYCLVRGDQAFIGPHVGDLENLETLQSYGDGIAHLGHLCGFEPRAVAHDLHPEYLSTKFAMEREADGMPAIAVQHHHAHFAGCLAEHGIEEPAVGLVFDGTGFGLDGTIWGGEVLVGDLRNFSRVGSLRRVRMPGGAAAIREPWRMACAWLTELSCREVPPIPETLAAEVSTGQWTAVFRLVRTGISSPQTTSVGRLLDAVAAICGVCARVSYEGQAAIELQQIADMECRQSYPFDVTWIGGQLVMDPEAMLRGVLADVARGEDVEHIAARVHNGLSYAAARLGALAAAMTGLNTIALTGGVFQNALLLERTASQLEKGGYRVVVPSAVPPNDGGVSFGQAAVAAARGRRDAHF